MHFPGLKNARNLNIVRAPMQFNSMVQVPAFLTNTSTSCKVLHKLFELKMNNEGKKITFSFSKVKKPALISKVNVEKEKIDYVDCFDGSKGKFSFKGNIQDEPQHQELVIPMPTSKTPLDIIKSRLEEKAKAEELSKQNNLSENNPESSKESILESRNIDEIAALEILKEARNENVDNKSTSKLIIETKNVPEAPSEVDIDYDNVPVKDFGLAMLRGMGWRPDQGIGKEPRLVEAASPKLRPRGLGLGAELNTAPNDDKHEEKEKDRDRSKEKEKDRDRDRNKEKEKEKDRDRDRDRNKEKEKLKAYISNSSSRKHKESKSTKEKR